MRLMPLLLVLSLVLAACGAPAATPVPPTNTAEPAAAATDTPAEAAATNTPEAVATDTPAEAAPTDTPAGAAAATPTKVKGAASKEGTLTIWVHKVAVPAVTNVGQAFTAKYNVPVVVQELDFGQIRDDLKLAGPAGEGPDIIVGAHDWLGELVTNGLLEPLDLSAKAESIDPVGMKAFTYEGKTYGLPYALEAIALIYNKDLVPTPPATWDELKTVAKQLQDEGKVDQGYVLQQGDPYHAYPFWTGHDSFVFAQNPDGTYDPTQVGLDNEGGKAAIKEIDQMVKDGLLRKDITGQISDSMFVEGKSAMVFGGPWRINDLKKSGINYGIAKIPPMTADSRPFVGAQGFMVSYFGKNKLLAQAFLTEFVAADDTMQQIYDADPRIPAWLPVQQKVDDADIKAFAESAKTGFPMPAIPQMSAVWTDWTKAIDLVFQQAQDPEAAITDAANAIREKIK
jgi:maltose/maltodextrin transport system substrate-binding protein/arabinogalactan oligomer/maltooligosaccharide transport system substrate-binding protein